MMPINNLYGKNYNIFNSKQNYPFTKYSRLKNIQEIQRSTQFNLQYINTMKNNQHLKIQIKHHSKVMQINQKKYLRFNNYTFQIKFSCFNIKKIQTLQTYQRIKMQSTTPQKRKKQNHCKDQPLTTGSNKQNDLQFVHEIQTIKQKLQSQNKQQLISRSLNAQYQSKNNSHLQNKQQQMSIISQQNQQVNQVLENQQSIHQNNNQQVDKNISPFIKKKINNNISQEVDNDVKNDIQIQITPKNSKSYKKQQKKIYRRNHKKIIEKQVITNKNRIKTETKVNYSKNKQTNYKNSFKNSPIEQVKQQKDKGKQHFIQKIRPIINSFSQQFYKTMNNIIQQKIKQISQSIQSQPIQSLTMQSQPMQSQPMQNQPMQNQSMQNQSMQNQPIQAKISQDFTKKIQRLNIQELKTIEKNEYTKVKIFFKQRHQNLFQCVDTEKTVKELTQQYQMINQFFSKIKLIEYQIIKRELKKQYRQYKNTFYISASAINLNLMLSHKFFSIMWRSYIRKQTFIKNQQDKSISYNLNFQKLQKDGLKAKKPQLEQLKIIFEKDFIHQSFFQLNSIDNQNNKTKIQIQIKKLISSLDYQYLKIKVNQNIWAGMNFQLKLSNKYRQKQQRSKENVNQNVQISNKKQQQQNSNLQCLNYIFNYCFSDDQYLCTQHIFALKQFKSFQYIQRPMNYLYKFFDIILKCYKQNKYKNQIMNQDNLINSFDSYYQSNESLKNALDNFAQDYLTEQKKINEKKLKRTQNNLKQKQSEKVKKYENADEYAQPYQNPKAAKYKKVAKTNKKKQKDKDNNKQIKASLQKQHIQQVVKTLLQFYLKQGKYISYNNQNQQDYIKLQKQFMNKVSEQRNQLQIMTSVYKSIEQAKDKKMFFQTCILVFKKNSVAIKIFSILISLFEKGYQLSMDILSLYLKDENIFRYFAKKQVNLKRKYKRILKQNIKYFKNQHEIYIEGEKLKIPISTSTIDALKQKTNLKQTQMMKNKRRNNKMQNDNFNRMDKQQQRYLPIQIQEELPNKYQPMMHEQNNFDLQNIQQKINLQQSQRNRMQDQIEQYHINEIKKIKSQKQLLTKLPSIRGNQKLLDVFITRNEQILMQNTNIQTQRQNLVNSNEKIQSEYDKQKDLNKQKSENKRILENELVISQNLFKQSNMRISLSFEQQDDLPINNKSLNINFKPPKDKNNVWMDNCHIKSRVIVQERIVRDQYITKSDRTIPTSLSIESQQLISETIHRQQIHLNRTKNEQNRSFALNSHI